MANDVCRGNRDAGDERAVDELTQLGHAADAGDGAGDCAGVYEAIGISDVSGAQRSWRDRFAASS